MKFTYRTRGTCSSSIEFEIDENELLHNVRYTGGCNGNLKAIGILTEGANAREISAKLKGNTCGFRSTSCADQLACAIEEALAK